MSISVIGGYNSSSFGNPAVNVLTLAGAAPTGSSVLISILQYNAVVSSITDSKGNTYARDLTFTAPAGYPTGEQWSAHNVTALSAGDTITVTFVSSPLYVGILALSATGLVTVATTDKTASGITTATTAATAQANELVVALGVMYSGTDVTWTGDAGYVTQGTVGTYLPAYGVKMEMIVQTREVTAIGAQTVTMTPNPSASSSGVGLVTYKQTAPGGGGGGGRMMRGIG